MKKLADQFYENAIKFSDKIAICCEDRSITYDELSNLVSKYSNYLLNNEVKYGDNIGFPMNNSIESVALILTAANIGVGLVPINPTMPLESIKRAFEISDVKHVIAKRVFFEDLNGLNELEFKGTKFCLDDTYKNIKSLKNAMEFSKKRPIIDNISGDETLIITMTSGSTGSPKPINLTQNNKLRRAKAHIKLYDITIEDVILAGTPLYHSLALRLVLIPLLIGGTSVLLSRFTPTIWLKNIKKRNVTFTIAVSAQLSQIADLLSSPFVPEIDSLRCVVSSSSKLEIHKKNELIEKLVCDFHEIYGTSEISTATDINFIEDQNHKKSVGKPISEADIRIIKNNGELAKKNEIGEIACKTKLMCNGYYGMSKIFSNSLENGYFKTGDLGYIDEDGFLYFSGRKKNLIITGGINVYPSDVENCVLELPQVKECAAFGFPDDRLGEVVAIAIITKPDVELNKRTIRVSCARNLADFQQPHQIFFVDNLPKNSMGKLERYKMVEYIKRNGLDS